MASGDTPVMKLQDATRRRQRIDYLDVARGIGVLLVLFGHLFRAGGRPSLVIFSFHMPLFFIVSGALFNPDRTLDFISFVKKKFTVLIVPYFIVCFIGLFFTLIIPGWSDGLTLGPILVDVFYRGAPNILHVGQVWFLVCLFSVEVTAWFMYKAFLCKADYRAVICVVLGIAWVGVMFPHIEPHLFVLGRVPWMLDSAIPGLAFYLVGFYIKRSGLLAWMHQRLSPTCKACGGGLLIMLTFISATTWLGSVNLGAVLFGSPLLYYGTSLAGSFSILLIAMCMEGCQPLRVMGKHSLPLFSSHSLFIYLLASVASWLTGTTYAIMVNLPKSLVIFGGIGVSIALWLFAFALERFNGSPVRTAIENEAVKPGTASSTAIPQVDAAVTAVGVKSCQAGESPASAPRSFRNSTIELLRIICMAAIVLHHCVVHSGAFGMMNPGTNKILASLILPLGKISFTCFVAISMWFLCESRFKGRRFLRTWLVVLFYSVLMTIVAKLLGGHVGKRDLIGALLPIGGNTHGFASTYLAFYLLLPLLGRMAEGLSKKQVNWVVAVLVYLQVLERIFAGFGLANLQLHQYMSEPTLFVLCFFVSLRLRKWPEELQKNVRALGLLAMGTWLLVFCIYWASWAGPIPHIAVQMVSLLATDESSLLYLVGGFSLFLFFNALPRLSSAPVNRIASTAFGILLIHDATFFRTLLWNNLIDLKGWWDSDLYAPILLMVCLSVFACCSLVDLLRQRVLEQPLTRSAWFSSMSAKLESVWTV